MSGTGALLAFFVGWSLSFGLGRALAALRRWRPRRPDPRILLLLLAAFALRVGGLTAQSLWRDEVDALRFGRDLTAEVAEVCPKIAGQPQPVGRLDFGSIT